MTSFRIVCGATNALEFAHPQRILRAYSPDEARAALDEADRARRAGSWIAGYLSYELGAAFAKEPVRPTTWPLLALGVFDAPSAHTVPKTFDAHAVALLACTDFDEYARAIEAIRASIYEGNVYQVNYTIPFAVHGASDPYAWWCAIAAKSGARYQAFVEDDARRILSWSPELFLAFDGKRIETRPMKGTAPLDAIEELDNAKNRAEHVMIVDLLRNDLHRVCDDVVVERMFDIERYPTLATMTSTIVGHLRNKVSLREVFEATFPCGSITGAPKRAAIAHIAALEPRTRDIYCGTIGYLSPDGRGWWNVAIRTAQVDLASNSSRFDTGGGIVADSRPDDEWDEVLIKSAFLRSDASEIELLETFASDASDERIDLHVKRLVSTASRFGAAIDEDAARRAFDRFRVHPDLLVRARSRLDGTLEIRTDRRETPEEPVRVCLSSERVRSDDAFLRVKTSHRPVHAAAAHEAAIRGCFEALLRNERDEVTEGVRTNLFVERNGTLLTPPVECGLLPGILRSVLVSEGRAREQSLTVEDIASAQAIYIGNSARGLLRATLVKDAQ